MTRVTVMCIAISRVSFRDTGDKIVIVDCVGIKLCK